MSEPMINMVRLTHSERRDRWMLYAAYPGKTLRYFTLRFHRWATLPGDTWMDFQRDQCGIPEACAKAPSLDVVHVRTDDDSEGS